MKGKAGQHVWDLREPSETEMLWMTHSRKALQCFSIWMDTGVSRGKSRFQYFQCHFSTAVSWTYTLCPTSLCWNQPLLRGENGELILWMSEASQRASLVPAAVASPWSEGQPHPAGQWGKWGNYCSLFENVPLFKAVFLPWAHVPAGSFLQGLGCKMRPQGQAQKDCRVPRLFLWMAALTRRYNDSLCS